jgi:hypothetical protein
MIGLYRLPLLYASEETGLKRREVLSALIHLGSLDFAEYDERSEFVWVREMARIQLGLLCGEVLKEGDKRAKGAAGLYKHLHCNTFLGRFFDRYAEVLRLPLRRDFESERKPLGSPLEGASEPLGRGPYPDPDPDRVPVPDKSTLANEKRKLSKPVGTPVPLPEDFKFTAELRTWALDEGCKEPYVEFEQFCDKAKSKGLVYVDWPAAFRTWIRNAVKWEREKFNGKALSSVR